jgi:hypothetical protein
MSIPFSASGLSLWRGLKCQTPGCDGKGSHVWFSHDRDVQDVACLECYCRITKQRVP